MKTSRNVPLRGNADTTKRVSAPPDVKLWPVHAAREEKGRSVLGSALRAYAIRD